MANLNIAEFSKLTRIEGAEAGQIADLESLVAEQVVLIGTEVDSAAFNEATRIIRVEAEAICKVTYGTAPTANATTGAIRMVAGQTEYYGVAGGKKISVISSS